MGIFDFMRKPKEQPTKEQPQGVAPCGGDIKDHYISGDNYLFCEHCMEVLRGKFQNPPPTIHTWL